MDTVTHMTRGIFDLFFQGKARIFLLQSIDLALDEDGPDLTSQSLFATQDQLTARIVAKESAVLAGLPLVPIVLDRIPEMDAPCRIDPLVEEGQEIQAGQEIVRMTGPARTLLKAERVLLNYLSHMSGVATLTRAFVRRMGSSRTRLLDTRKTLPGLRYVEKYAVRVGGGFNHRLDLSQMLMLKDNHIDRAGSITLGVEKLRQGCRPCPPIEVECRDLAEVDEAVVCRVDRIMLDNMAPETMAVALARIPRSIETEVSGGVNLDSVARLAELGADFISAGCITNSARAVDMSMSLARTSQGVPFP